MIFKDRKEAGQKLGEKLAIFKERPETLIIALPRGGVVVGFEVAKLLHLPLDIVSPRKIGAPFNPELAIGAITETGEGFFSKELIDDFQIPENYIQKTVEIEKKRALERLKNFRKDRPPRQLEGKTVIIVDDGLATGSTMKAAIATVKKEKAGKTIVAVPVSAQDTFYKIESLVDQLIVLDTPTSFYAVGQFYENFDQTTDAEVIDLLNKSTLLHQ